MLLYSKDLIVFAFIYDWGISFEIYSMKGTLENSYGYKVRIILYNDSSY